MAFRLVEYEHRTDAASYGLEAAEATGVDGSQIFKTLLASLDDGEIVVGVVPVVCQLDLKALARVAGSKRAAMASAEVAERRTGYVVGGISPFGQRRRHRTFVDESASLHPEIYVSGGRRGLEIIVDPNVFEDLLGAAFADLTA